MNKNPFERFDKPSAYLPEDKEESFYLDNINKRLDSKTKVKSLIGPSWMIGIAASLLIVSIYFLLDGKPKNPNLLAVSSFQPYKNYQTEKTRGGQSETKLSKAFEAYDKKDYEMAEAEFEVYSQQLSPLDKLYYSISLIGNNKYSEASSLLIGIESSLPKEHKNAWLFYSALCDLQRGNVDSARSLLLEMIDDKSLLSDEAKDLLKRLN